MAQRPSELHDPSTTRGHKTYWVGIAFAIVVAATLVVAAWYIYARLRARRLGLPPPSLNPFNRNRNRAPARVRSGGVVTWFKDKLNIGSEGYTGTRVRSGRRGFGALDPDEAWDTRVGNEADGYGYGQVYGDEQELGVTHPPAAGTDYQGRGYGPTGGLEEIEPQGKNGRGRAHAKEELDERYDEEMHGGTPNGPFSDGAERSKLGLRGISPRPHVADDDSPSERRTMFREDV